MTVVLEVGGDLLELAAALDEHVLVGVDQDVADRRVAQQRLQRPEPEHVVEQLDEQRLALAEAERRALFGEQLAEQRADLALGARAIRLRQRLEVQPVEQLLVDAGFQLEVLRTRRLRLRAAERRRRKAATLFMDGYQTEAMPAVRRSRPGSLRRAGCGAGATAPGSRICRVK